MQLGFIHMAGNTQVQEQFKSSENELEAHASWYKLIMKFLYILCIHLCCNADDD